MLKSNGPPPNINSPTSGAAGLPPPDYHREANHFEDKLIQVNCPIILMMTRYLLLTFSTGGRNAWRTDGVQFSSAISVSLG